MQIIYFWRSFQGRGELRQGIEVKECIIKSVTPRATGAVPAGRRGVRGAYASELSHPGLRILRFHPPTPITNGDSYPRERCFRHRALRLPVNRFRPQHRVQICVALKTPLCYNFPTCPVTPEFVQPRNGASTETSCPVPRSPVPCGYSPTLNPTHLCRVGSLLSLFHPFPLPQG